MSLNSELTGGALVQIVTDYTTSRVGQIDKNTSLDEEYIKLVPYNDTELRKLIYGSENDSTIREYMPSVLWPILIFKKTIKEIIILKNGDQTINY